MGDKPIVYRCPACGSFQEAQPEHCEHCNVISDVSEWGAGHWVEAAKTTDTADIPGDIIGPGDDPFAEDSVIVDTRRAVLLSYSDVCVTRNGGDDQEFCALMLRGRVNRATEVSSVLYLTGPDGMAALVSQIVGVAKRRGGEFGDEFGRLLIKRMEELPQRPTEGGA